MKTRITGIVGQHGPIPKLPKTFPSEIDDTLYCGLDLGIGSCGQALISTAASKRLIRGFEGLPGPISFLGIRAFDVPETKEQSGVKLKNPERRQKRLMRRTIARRAARMKQIRRFLMAKGVLPEDYHCLKDEWRHSHEAATPWQWRMDALSRTLSNWEWAVILLHYAKRRGFKSARKSDVAAKGSEGGTLDSVKANHEAVASYHTLAEMFHADPRFATTKRNKEGNYTSMVLRADLLDEITKVFEAQRGHGNQHASAEFEAEYLAILNNQKPMQSPIALLGNCPFVPSAKRTTVFAPSFELSRALQRLNVIVLVHEDGTKQLFSEFITNAGGYAPFVAAFGTKAKISWRDLRKLWNMSASMEFKDIRERGSATDKSTLENEDFCKRSTKGGCASGSHVLRKVVGESEWALLLSSDLTLLDEIAFCLAFYEVIGDEVTPFTILGAMAESKIPPLLLEAVRNDLTGTKPTLHMFKGACGVSAAVCRSIIPHLMHGLTYDKAMEAAGYMHTETLPSFHEISNPVVKAVVREVMKQVVHLFDEAGALPARIHVELGRDLGKSMQERNEMDRGIRDRTKEKDTNREKVAAYKQCQPAAVSDEDLLRYELYLEQGGICAYSGRQMPNPERLYGPDLEVDHILPRSRSHDNGYDNKVLVYTASNRDKRNQTPFEWLSSTPLAWQEFQVRVMSIKSLRRRKRRNLLNDSFAASEQEFAERNLNDTRYISRLVTAYLEALYEEAGHKPVREGGTRHVFTRPGAMTSLVRRAWGLENLKKDMDGKRIGDKHHAVDALVCACLAEGDAQWISRLSKCYGSMELAHHSHLTLRNLETPWQGFRADVVNALGHITVSRRERCGAGGPLHPETIYRAKPDGNGGQFAYKRETVITKDERGKAKAAFTKPADLEKIAGIKEERSKWLEDALLAWIQKGSPVDDPPRDPQGCIIRKVFVRQKSMRLRPQPQGHVTGGTLIRCDVFSKKGRFHLVPVYKHQLIERRPPNHAIVALKPEDKWDVLDSTFRFEFSLWKNSRFEIEFKDNEKIEGCYSSLNRNTGRIAYHPPDNSNGGKDANGKEIDYGFSTKIGVVSFRKISVDRLGRRFPVKKEKRTWRGEVCI